MIAFLIILGAVAIGMVIGLIAVVTSPDGYQDETGFHYGAEHCEEKKAFARRATEPGLALAKSSF